MTHPDLLESLMVDAAWQSSLCLVLGLLASRLPIRPARANGLLLIAIVASMLSPILSLVVRSMGWGLLAPSAVASVIEPTAPPSSADTATFESLWLPSPFVLIAAVWMGVTSVLVLRLVRSMRRGRRLVIEAVPTTDASTNMQVRGAARRLGIAIHTPVLRSEAVRCPVIWCWSRVPRIVVPADADPETLSCDVFCHELAHWIRRDHLGGLLGEILQAMMPFNPLAWMARRRLRFLSEEACDAWVLAAGSSPTTYAETLLQLAVQPPQAWTLAAVSGRQGLPQRIVRILETRPAGVNCGRGWRWIAAACMLAVITTTAFAHRRAAMPEKLAEPPDRSAGVAASPIIAVDTHSRLLGMVSALPAELDLGVTTAGASKIGTIWLVNNSEERRYLRSYKASCGCTTVNGFVPGWLEPGGSLMMEITMRGPSEAGQHKMKLVTFRIDGQATLRLPVHLDSE